MSTPILSILSERDSKFYVFAKQPPFLLTWKLPKESWHRLWPIWQNIAYRVGSTKNDFTANTYH